MQEIEEKSILLTATQDITAQKQVEDELEMPSADTFMRISRMKR